MSEFETTISNDSSINIEPSTTDVPVESIVETVDNAPVDVTNTSSHLLAKPSVVCTVAGSNDWLALQQFYTSLRAVEPNEPIIITCDETVLLHIAEEEWTGVTWILSAGLVDKSIPAKTDVLIQGILGFGDALYCDCNTRFTNTLPIIDKTTTVCLSIYESNCNCDFIWTSSFMYLDILDRLYVLYSANMDDHAITMQSTQYFQNNTFDQNVGFSKWCEEESCTLEEAATNA